MKKYISISILILITIFLLPMIRLDIQSKNELIKAEKLESKIFKGKKDRNFYSNFKLIFTYEKACHLYTPLFSSQNKAINKLIYLGNYFEKHKEIKLAKYAWLAAKSCILSTRSYFKPDREKLATINQHISTLFKDKRALTRQNIKDPSLLFSILMLIGLILWTGSIITIILLEGRKIKLLFPTFILGYVLWIISIFLL